MTGRITDTSRDLSGKLRITLTLDGCDAEVLDELTKCEKLDVNLKKHREKRSLDANAYCWVLLGKLSVKLNIPPKEIYKQLIKDIGGNYEIVCVRNDAVERLQRAWEANGIGWGTNTLPSKVNGCTNLVLWYGSSTYDTEQMSRLINLIVQECKEQGIETETPEEQERMLEKWAR